MALTSIGQFDIRTGYEALSRIPVVNTQPQDIKQDPSSKIVIKEDQADVNVSPDEQSKQPELRYRNNAPIEDISLSIRYDKDNAMNGAESDINSLDMEKIVSDAKKDSILAQYQYFVGDDVNVPNLEDGIMIVK
ncbi:MAG: hypothetical protein K6B28_12590 [Lachnospiraceae bacterium]|nr:hypothetical protein [Lachnospiraceae bacterium]